MYTESRTITQPLALRSTTFPLGMKIALCLLGVVLIFLKAFIPLLIILGLSARSRTFLSASRVFIGLFAIYYSLSSLYGTYADSVSRLPLSDFAGHSLFRVAVCALAIAAFAYLSRSDVAASFTRR